jgi:uncharacterized protein
MRLLAARLVALLLCLCAALAWAAPGDESAGPIPIPVLTARVTDLTGTLSAEQKSELEQRLADFEARKGAQVVVLMLPTTQPESIEEFGIRLFDAWKVGRKGVDDGVMLIVAKNDRRLRIEVGYGLEGVLTDSGAKRIISDTITPLFKKGDFHGGISAGVDAILQVVDKESLPAPTTPAKTAAGSSFDESGGFLSIDGVGDYVFYGALFAVVVGGAVLRYFLGNLLGSALVGVATGGIGWLFIGGLTGIAIGMVAGMFLAMFGLDLLLSGIVGGSGGSSGGGGFSGGGGSGGGGGASGSW